MPSAFALHGAQPPASSNQQHGLPRWLGGKEPTCQHRRHKFDPWVGESHEQGTLPATVPGVLKSWTQLSTHQHGHHVPSSAPGTEDTEVIDRQALPQEAVMSGETD